MKIGIVRTPQDKLSFYRTHAWVVELKRMGHEIISFHPSDRLSYAKCDWVFGHMLFGKGAERVIEVAKQMGCKVWIDVDDNIWSVPFSNISFEWHMSKDRQYSILTQADLVTVSTEPLLKMMENFLMMDKVMLLENYLWIDGFTPPREDGKIVIAWRGGDHREDFPMIVKELYALELEADEIHYFGDRPAQYTPTGSCKVLWHPHVDTWKYMETLKKVNPILMFGYWADIPFNSTKSDIMLQEATAAGAVLVMNEGWNAFNGKPCYTYTEETLRRAIASCKGDINMVRELWRNAVDLMANKDTTRIMQIREVSARLKRGWERIELDPYIFESDTMTDTDYYVSEGVNADHDGDEQFDRERDLEN